MHDLYHDQNGTKLKNIRRQLHEDKEGTLVSEVKKS